MPIDTRLPQRDSRSVRPTRYELIDKDGIVIGDFDSAKEVADWAARNYPGQEQDPDRTGKGWDIQIAGAK